MTILRIVAIIALLAPAGPSGVAGASESGTSEPGASGPGVLPLTVAQAVDMARQESARLAQLRSLDAAAAQGLRGARAQRLPAMDLLAGYARESNLPVVTVPQPVGGSLTIFPNIPNTYRSRIEFAQPLYAGGRIQNLIASAAGDREAARLDVETGARDLDLETVNAYWDLVAARENERVLREAIAAYEAHLVDARSRVEVGMAARNELLAVQVERDRAELARLEATNARDIAEADLRRLLGVPPGPRIEPTESLDPPPAIEESLEPLVATALEARPERAALFARVKAAQSRAEAERAAARPQASLEGGYDYSRPNLKILPHEDVFRSTWDVSLNLSWKVFDSGRTAAAVAQARAQAEAARHQLEDLDRRIRLDVTARFLYVATDRAALEVAERNREAALENQRVSRDRYREGVIPSSELLDSETSVLRAGLARTREITGLRVALAALDRAVGR